MVDKDLVLLGGGHAHVAVLKSFGMRPIEGLRLVLVSREVHAPYSGMLPGFVAGHYSYDEVHIDLRRLARFAGAELHHAEAVGLDLAARRVLLKDRPPLRFDLLSIDVGIRPRADLPGASRAIAVKPIDSFAARWEKLLARAKQGPLRVAVVGGGAAGVELALAIQHRTGAALTIVSAGELLPTHGRAVRRAFSRVLAERRVEVLAGTPVIAIEAGGVRTADRFVEADEVLLTTQAVAPEWLARSGLATEDGFVRVDETLRSTSHANVFAAGDVANVAGHPRPKAGVFAVRQGPPLAENLRREVLGQPLVRYAPQRRFLALVSTGGKEAVASKWPGVAFRGAWVWKWKDSIDRRFMRKFSDLAMNGARPMASGSAPHDAMRCAGCGAKVGSSILARVLERVGIDKRDDILIGLDEPDDAAILAPSPRAQVQTIDFFRAIVDDPFTFGAIAANHALGDVWAMGATPRAALALATIPHGPERRVEELLFQMLSGSLRVLREAGCALVGGHSGEGAELALGFSVTGEVEKPLRKAGARPGDRLILTKAIGTGILFAAEMRLLAKARWIESAIESMLASSRDAARILAKHGATACTDVTGFGLAGHLLEMARASKVTIEIAPAKVPLLEGVAELAGVRSTLFPQNEVARASIAGSAPDFLFDPQTAGGLVATVPASAAEACLAELRAAGVAAAEIGSVEAASDLPLRIRT